MKLHLIIYNKGEYDPNKFTPIQNRRWNKPMGGLWASPINARYGWKEWCTKEQFAVCDISNSCQLVIDGNIMVIDSVKDMDKMPMQREEINSKAKSYYYGSAGTVRVPAKSRTLITTFPDFERMVKRGIDAIYLTEKGESETRYSKPRSLYGWDCECVLILNKGIIQPILQPSAHITMPTPVTDSEGYAQPVYVNPQYQA